MHISQRGKALLREWEGLEHHVYLDSGGAPTIGIGHVLTLSERRSGKLILVGLACDYKEGLTDAQCVLLLTEDLAPCERTIERLVNVPLRQSQYDCLCSFVLNVGSTAFRTSTLLRLLNQGAYAHIPSQLRRWIHDNGVVVQGLVNRRAKEIALWNTPESEISV